MTSQHVQGSKTVCSKKVCPVKLLLKLGRSVFSATFAKTKETREAGERRRKPPTVACCLAVAASPTDGAAVKFLAGGASFTDGIARWRPPGRPDRMPSRWTC